VLNCWGRIQIEQTDCQRTLSEPRTIETTVPASAKNWNSKDTSALLKFALEHQSEL